MPSFVARSSLSKLWLRYLLPQRTSGFYVSRFFSAKASQKPPKLPVEDDPGFDEEASEISGRTLSEILKELSKRVPESVVKVRAEKGFELKYVPWHVINRIMNLHAPEWSGEVRSITYSPGGKSVSVAYRVTVYATDGEVHRESIGTATIDDTSFGDPVQKAEAMAFRRACARLGLGLHLYHEDIS